MNFKIFGVNIEIGFLFTASVAFLLVFNVDETVKLGIVFSLLHEAGHLAAIVLCKQEPERISFGLFGMTITRQSDITQNYQKEIFTALAGPATNYALSLLLFSVYLKIKNELIYKCIITNFIIGTFNIMPVFELDGGRALESMLKIKLEAQQSEAIIKAVSFWVLVIMMSFGFYILISTGYNFTLFAISVYLTVMLFIKC